MADPEIRARWEQAIGTATDQRSLNIAKNVRSKEIREKLEEAADNAARSAVTEATKDVDVRVMFLIDKSGSMQGAIEQSKEALTKILAGLPAREAVHRHLRHHGHRAAPQGGRRARRCSTCSRASTPTAARCTARRCGRCRARAWRCLRARGWW